MKKTFWSRKTQFLSFYSPVSMQLGYGSLFDFTLDTRGLLQVGRKSRAMLGQEKMPVLPLKDSLKGHSEYLQLLKL